MRPSCRANTRTITATTTEHNKVVSKPKRYKRSRPRTLSRSDFASLPASVTSHCTIGSTTERHPYRTANRSAVLPSCTAVPARRNNNSVSPPHDVSWPVELVVSPEQRHKHTHTHTHIHWHTHAHTGQRYDRMSVPASVAKYRTTSTLPRLNAVSNGCCAYTASHHNIDNTHQISAATTSANDAHSTHRAIPLLHRYRRIDSRPHKPSYSIHAVFHARRHHRSHSALHTCNTSAATTP